MKIIQLIDSLEAGGAERMAVNYANELSLKIDFSGLVVSRKEGFLLNQINENVNYFFLNKKKIIDFKAILKLNKFIKSNKIDLIHAHSTSFFLAFIIKLINPRLKLLWHDHYGDSEFLNKRPSLSLKLTIPFFWGIIAVNQNLKTWAYKTLNSKNVIFLPNFPLKNNESFEKTILKGSNNKRIVCLANLRAQKNHFLLIKLAEKLKISNSDWTFHLVGKDFMDSYSKKIKSLIIESSLQDNVFIYDSKQDIENILNQSEIAILTSSSEGLPLALLEYGLYKKPVVVTDVGEIPAIICNNENGILIPTKNAELFLFELINLIENQNFRINLGQNLFKTISIKYSKQVVITQYLNWIDKL